MSFPNLYGLLARQRRRWYEARPEARRRLENPVVSVGALSVGGSGKTPVTAEVVNVLLSLGERPAVLSRGYGRMRRLDGATVVSESGVLQSGIDAAGDEPFMLARRLRKTSVVVAEDRYLAGRLAEAQLGATVHVLDDGFQHLTLRREVDLVVIGRDDLADTRTLPLGRLREPIDALKRASGLIVEEGDAAMVRQLAEEMGVADVFHYTRRLEAPRDTETSDAAQLAPGTRVLAVAGIARPRAFVDGLTSAGYDVVDLMAFPDHHLYSNRDVQRIGHRLTAVGADHVMTTEKDAVRLLGRAPLACSVLWVPLVVSVEPAATFRDWLSERLVVARRQL